MPDLRQYESQLSREAVGFVVGLSKKRQRVVLDLADQIAKQPSKIGDYQSAEPLIDTVRQRGTAETVP